MMMQDRILEILTESSIPLNYEQIAGKISETQSITSIKNYTQRLIAAGLVVGDKRAPARDRPRMFTTPERAHLLPVGNPPVRRQQQSWDGVVDARAIAWAASPFAMAESMAADAMPQPARTRTYESGIEDAITVIRDQCAALRAAGDNERSTVLLSAIKKIKRVSRGQ